MSQLQVASNSIKSNFVYNIINTVSGLLFPLITFPYASRVLMVEGIGQVQFFTSIINYIVLLTSLGIPMYAIRETAGVRDDIKKLSKTTTEILSLNLLLSFLGYIVVFVICGVFGEVKVNIPLFLLLSTSILLTTIGCTWFYSGIEDFKFVTIRGLIVKTLGVIFLFLFVRTQDDLLWYGIYAILGSVGNNVINFLRLRKYVDIKSFYWKEIKPFRHLKPSLEIFVFNLIASVYINLDTVMIGFLKDNIAVGFYTAATKISHLLLTIVTALSPVMLPRLSNLIKNERKDEFYSLANKSYCFSLMLSLPMCLGLIVLSPTMIRLFSGESFEPAILTLQIISPIIVAIAISNFIGIQVLYPLGKIKIVTVSTAVGAIVNFALNLLLIPDYSQNGAAIATVAAEWGVTFTQFFLAYKIIPFRLINWNFIKYLVVALIMALFCGVFMKLEYPDYVNIIVVPIMGVFVYGIIMLLIKDKLTLEMTQIINKKLHI